MGWVIVIEDNLKLRVRIIDTLSEIGLRSLDFETADAAWTYLSSIPDGCPMVIANHDLPGHIQGAEFIKMVQAEWPFTAAILTSDYALDPSIMHSSTVYLEKPWSVEDLEIALEILLQPGRMLRQML